MNLKKLIDSGDYAVKYNETNDLLLFPESVAVAIFDVESKVLVLVEQYRSSIGKISIELPGGKVNNGETLALAAERELLEEAGLEGCDVRNVLSLDMDLSVSKHVTHVFFGEGRVKINNQKDHEFQCLSIEISKAYEMIIKGEITHAPTVAAILWIKEKY